MTGPCRTCDKFNEGSNSCVHPDLMTEAGFGKMTYQPGTVNPYGMCRLWVPRTLHLREIPEGRASNKIRIALNNLFRRAR